MFIVLSHIGADFDSLACMIAVKKLYPEVVMVASGGIESNVKRFLADFPKFALKKERTVDITDVHRLIIVDTSRKDRLGNFKSLLNRLQPELLVDHHVFMESDIEAHQKIIEPSGAAISLFMELLIDAGVTLTPEEASIMAMGIYEDTGFFTHSGVTAKDFQMMSYLFSSGADVHLINRYVRHEMNPEQFEVLKVLSQNLEEFQVDHFPVYITTINSAHYIKDLSIVVQKLKKIHQFEIIIAIARLGKKGYLISRADEDTINCAELMKHYGGGGHPVSASAMIAEDFDIEQVKLDLVEMIRKQLTTSQRIFEIMSYPVETVFEDDKVSQVRHKILQIHHDSLIVITRAGKVAGLISKDEIDRAWHHQLKESLIRDFMTSDLIELQPQTSIQELKHHISSTYQKKFPVVDQGELVGIVTSNDLLNSLLKLEIQDNVEWGQDQDILPRMKEFFSELDFSILERLSQVADLVNMQAFIVGGIVRDLLLERFNDDIDIVIEGDTKTFVEKYVEKFGGHYTFYSRFHTATMTTGEGLKIDVASARIELYEEPAALPQIQKSVLRYDLYRRDFTINSVAINLNKNNFGKLIDFFSGRRDLSNGLIRVLHNLSFIEDPTRIIRAIRFEQRFDFKIVEQTVKLIQSALDNKIFEKVTPQRLQNEIVYILEEENPVKSIKRLSKLGIFRKLPAPIPIEQEHFKLFEAIHTFIKWYNLLMSRQPIKNWVVYYYGILHIMNLDERSAFFRVFALSKQYLENYKKISKFLDKLELNLSAEELPDSVIYNHLTGFENEELIFLLAYFESSTIRQHIMRFITELKGFKLFISGKDIISMGLKPGKDIRVVLDEVRNARLDHLISSVGELEFAEKVVKNLLQTQN